MIDRGLLIRRILFALDSGTNVPAGLDVAVEIAGRLRAELEGLYVEDNDLFQVAQLPFTTQVNLMTGSPQPLLAADLERQMARLASSARRRLADAATRGRVRWTFRTVRGRIAQEVAAAAELADLVIVEGGLHKAPAQERLGLSSRTTIQSVSRSVLILRAGRRFEGPVSVVFDGTALGEKALAMADLLTPDNDALTVLIADPDAEKRRELEARARELLGASAGDAHFRTLRTASLTALCEEVHGHDSGLLVLGADDPLLPKSGVAEILDSLACPVLLVR
jgi:hypothetical protein